MTPFTTGSGRPVTVAAHGLGATLAQTRSLLGGVPGTKVFPVARGHAGAPDPTTGGYGELAADLRAVADSCGATQALGVSLGAATLLRSLVETPDRWERLVLFLPATFARAGGAQRPALARDPEVVAAAVRAELPTDLSGPLVDAYVRDRTAALLASSGLATLVAGLGEPPVPDARVLRAVTADVLVLAQDGDLVHPAQVAREIVEALPRARLVVFEQPGVVFRERARLRSLIVGHLAAPDGCTGAPPLGGFGG